jgi:hypothetical protein
MLDVPAELLRYLSRLLAAGRRLRGTPAGSRQLSCRDQAVPALWWFRVTAVRHRISSLFRDDYDDERNVTRGFAKSTASYAIAQPRPIASSAVAASGEGTHDQVLVRSRQAKWFRPAGGAGRNQEAAFAALGSHEFSADACSPDRAQHRGVRRQLRGFPKKEPA